MLSGQVGLSNVSTAVTRIIRYVEREFKAEARTRSGKMIYNAV